MLLQPRPVPTFLTIVIVVGEESVRYPVIVFPFDGRSIVVAIDDSFFQEATRSQLKAGFFSTPFGVVDSEANEFNVDKLVVAGGAGLFGGWNLFANQSVKIELSFRRVGQARVAGIRERVMTALMDDPTGIWRGAEQAPDELSRKIDQCDTLGEIFRVLLN